MCVCICVCACVCVEREREREREYKCVPPAKKNIIMKIIIKTVDEAADQLQAAFGGNRRENILNLAHKT